MIASACSDQVDGGDCEWETHEGTCRITNISPDEARACKGDAPTTVLIRFTTGDEAVDETLEFPSYGISDDYTLENSASQKQVADSSLKIGDEFPCTRQASIAGACSPVSFELEGVELGRFTNYCPGE